MKNIFEILRKLRMTIGFIILILISINLLADEQDLYHPGILNICFSSDLVGNTRGDFTIHKEDGIIITPFEWFNILSNVYHIIELERMYLVQDTEWHLDGQYPMNVFRLEVEDHSRTSELQEILSSNNDVLFAEFEAITRTFYTPNDPDIFLQWSLEKVQAFEAWDIERGSEEILIGIVDSGIKWNHPDLRANIWINEAELPGMTINWEAGTIIGPYGHSGNQTSGGANYWGDVMGWDFYTTTSGGQSNNPFQNLAGSFHGTHVAGIAAAVGNNNVGISGLAPNVKIVATKHSPYGFISSSIYNPYAGIYYMTDIGANIINCSWGGGGGSSLSDLATSYAWSHHSLVVAAAGNNGWDIATYQVYPALSPLALTVAGTDEDDQRAIFNESFSSNYGTNVDVSAPAMNILSSTFDYNGIMNNSYVYASGTSMAAPIVSGIAALLLSQNPNLSMTQLRNHLRNGADPIDHLNPGFTGLLGSGRVNAYKSLLLARGNIGNDLIATNIYGETEIDENDFVYTTISIRNIGTNLADGYTVRLMEIDNPDPLFILPGEPLAQHSTAEFTFEWTPNASGQYTIYGEIVWNLDEVQSNNKTSTQNIVIIPETLTELYIGNAFSTQYLNNSFVNYNFQNSISQTIYTEENLSYGTIYKINYRFQGAGDINMINNIKLYMATTIKTAFSHQNDWIPFHDFIEVYSGNLDVSNIGIYDLEIVLNKPYEYLSDNLVIMAIRDHHIYYASTNAFQFTLVPELYQTLYWRTDSVESPIVEPFPVANGRLQGFTNILISILPYDDQDNVTNIDENQLLPKTKLYGNYPNPFNPETTINLYLAVVSNLRVDIYNIKGQKVKSLLNENKPSGNHNITWNGTDDNGNAVVSGVYLYRIEAGDFVEMKKMVMIK